MKKCTKCNETKSLDFFNWQNKSKGIKKWWCKECSNKYCRQRWISSEKRRDDAKKLRKERKIKTKNFIWQYLKNCKCVDCGESDPIVLEFDHKDSSTKKHNIGNMTNGSYSIETILKEIEKCDVRCANCHRRRTSKQFKWYSYIKD